MFKNDTMTQYVADRAPHLAPRTVWDRIDWTAAAVMQDARRRALASLTTPAAPVVSLATRRFLADPVVVEAFSLDVPSPA
jgi:hypothetical protein